ncbi:unnamed protein product [Trichogramma brassicae]|uniref:chitin synthase n=1 Tax=Trichogramma brassicae TaxID=86971 RepID=A0A6H5I0Q1_9HYME|nr:unnamed protein product [Trichogramma brassicae]
MRVIADLNAHQCTTLGYCTSLSRGLQRTHTRDFRSLATVDTDLSVMALRLYNVYCAERLNPILKRRETFATILLAQKIYAGRRRSFVLRSEVYYCDHRNTVAKLMYARAEACIAYMIQPIALLRVVYRIRVRVGARADPSTRYYTADLSLCTFFLRVYTRKNAARESFTLISRVLRTCGAQSLRESSFGRNGIRELPQGLCTRRAANRIFGPIDFPELLLIQNVKESSESAKWLGAGRRRRRRTRGRLLRRREHAAHSGLWRQVRPTKISSIYSIRKKKENNVPLLYLCSQRTVVETKGWDVFRDPPPRIDSGSMANQRCLEITVQITKVLVYLLVFVVVLGSGVIAKGTVLFMTSQLKAERTVVYCNRQLGKRFAIHTMGPTSIFTIYDFARPRTDLDKKNHSHRSRSSVRGEAARGGAHRLDLVHHHSVHGAGAGHPHTQPAHVLLQVVEEAHVVALSPRLRDGDVPRARARAHVLRHTAGPRRRQGRHAGQLRLLRARSARTDVEKQGQGRVEALRPGAGGSRRAGRPGHGLRRLAAPRQQVAVPLADTARPRAHLVSLVGELRVGQEPDRPDQVAAPGSSATSYRRATSPTSSSRSGRSWRSPSRAWSCSTAGARTSAICSLVGQAFGDHKIVVQAVRTTAGGSLPDLIEIMPDGDVEIVSADFRAPHYVLLLAILSGYFMYIFGKFACKILIQGFSYAFPVNLTIPVTISLLMAACGLRNADPCFFHGTIPDYLFFESPPMDFFKGLLSRQYAWVWLLWLLSQTWFTLHIWTPKCERLAATEKLFVTPMYDGLLVDQSMGLNRKRDDQPEVKVEDLAEIEREKGDGDYETIYDNPGTPQTHVKTTDHVTRIYACATMWHENKEEMIEFLKSILRLDEDQCARRVAQKYLKVVDPDYYEFETHIFFDDAFELADHDENESQVNRFVKLLVGTLDEAASDVHQTRMHVRAPKKYVTPYGGRLAWTLPGKTKMIAHLKDKSKIRHRKRWSQVMYMYYLLGHRLMELPISVDRKEVIAENTFLLTLDGDIDFQPLAVKLLVDLMKKNKNLGAACGRIHPVGSGPMVWYQMFEYAIGHWLQKATEHMIGCVLCSPGCFSLFRGKALMDDNVMKKYTTRSDEARHYVQYDQGEDRWLCTLLLQRGYRVEYSAASDAYTHAPEGFNEFYNQRRRWVPSTIANIMDLLMDAKRTIKINDNISMPYIAYQILLMGTRHRFIIISSKTLTIVRLIEL